MSADYDAAGDQANEMSVRFDETQSANGTPRPGWSFVLDRLDALGEQGLAARRTEITRQLRANGIGFNTKAPDSNPVPDAGRQEELGIEPWIATSTPQSADRTARPWPLDIVPMIIETEDWAGLEAGLKQRHRVMEALLADIYGEQSLLAERRLPPALIYAHPGYLRDAVGVAACQQLPLYGIDVSRAPSGDWYVADDLAEFPEGLGYTLENRLVLSKVLPQLFRQGRVRRLASYFRALQTLVIDSVDSDSRCVLLGRGADDPHHFELAWLSRYLGYTLVELGDLTVRGNRVFLRTVSGLERVHVVLRFVPDNSIDPLTSDGHTGKGLPGLMRAVAEGTVRLINPPGGAALGNPALNAYLPEIAKHLLGEKLILQSAPTYWLGEKQHLAHVMPRLNEVLIRDVKTHGALIDPDLLDQSTRAQLVQLMESVPERFVAQERIDRSVVPVRDADGVRQRQLTVRLHAVKATSQSDTSVVMAGGLGLLDNDRGGRRQHFDDLDGSKDVWVLSDQPVGYDTLLQDARFEAGYELVAGELPSRVAESLFWLGRNAERVEFTARLLRSIITEIQQEDSPEANQEPSTTLVALLKATTAVTGTSPGFAGRGAAQRLRRPDRELHALFNDADQVGSLANSLRQLDFSASAVRERISSDQLLVLNDLSAIGQDLEKTPFGPARDTDVLETRALHLQSILGRVAALTGLLHENLTHGEGWHFMMLGRRVARANLGASALNRLLDNGLQDSHVLEAALQLFDSVMTYRSRYRSRVEPHFTIHLLVLDEANPRSLAFQFQRIDEFVAKLPGAGQTYRPNNALSRLAAAGLSRVRLAEASSLVDINRQQRQSLARFLGILESLPNELSVELSARYFTHVDQRSDFGAGATVTPLSTS
jgi:uncharacterized circularly permuted ATP-grasp superfamily protein/uncharacterized alpha-E superfamily protein